jgi:GDP-4-dehydro-6-deoxy-D-mannose reductase
VSSIAKQVAEIARGKRDPVLTIGNGSIIRDFLDVRDVVEAYLKLVERGRSGEVYNVCSGSGRKIADIAAALSSIAGISVQVRTSADLIRTRDNPLIVGNNEKIRKEIGWQPGIPFEESLRAIYDYWYSRV